MLLGPTAVIERAQQQADVCVAELGFGTGLNFAVTASAVLQHSAARLHFISVEAHPLTHAQWQKIAQLRAHELPIYAAFSDKPLPLLRGWHQRVFARGRIVLTVYHGDVQDALDDLHRQQRNTVDVWYLDGFTPERNPSMWESQVFEKIAAKSHCATMLATFCAASRVRRSLQAVGFKVKRVDQQPHKRETIVARFDMPSSTRTAPSLNRVSILGAGIGGASMARHFAEQVIAVDLYDPNGVAGGGSKISAALMHGRLLGDRSVTAEHRAAAFHYATNYLADWPGVRATGVLQLPGPNLKPEKLLRIIHAYDAEHSHQQHWIRALTATEASALVGGPVDATALLFPTGKTVVLPQLCMALLNHPDIALHQQAPPIDNVTPTVICVGSAAKSIALPSTDNQIEDEPLSWLEITDVYGQLDTFPSHAQQPRVPVVGNGYVVPHDDGITVGATYEYRRWNPTDSTQHNYQLNQQYLDGDAHSTSYQHAARAVTSDRVPFIGQLQDNVWIATGHGSMGTTSAPYAAALVSNAMLGWLSPASAAVTQLLNPHRLKARQARRGIRHQ